MEKKYKLLIIEDSRTFNNMLKRAFSSISNEIQQVFTFKEAEQFLEKDEFDFIFLDLILPDGEGDELIENISKNLRNKIIVLSADDDIARRSHLFDMGILDYFSKLNPLNLIINDIKELIISLEINKKTNVLIIDDSSFMRKTLKNILTPRKYNLFLSHSAEDGLKIIQNNNVDLILLDVELSGISGLEFLEIIRKEKYALDVPVIAISGNDSPHIIARLLKHGASDFIKKPFIIEQLLLKCDLHIKNYRNARLLKQKTIELKKAEEVKSKFLANMSHEIRTPLNAILGFIELLEDKVSDEEGKRYLNVITNASHTLLSILNDVLDLSKIEAGKLSIENVDFDPIEEFNAIIELFEIKASEKQIKIHKNFINLPSIIRTDVIRLKQVLFNLLSNAIKFTPEGKNIYITIKYENNQLFFKIRDEGIGLTKDEVKTIFRAFTQADDSTTRKYGGTGLGLTISSEIIRLLKGELKVLSKKDEFSEFYFEIPVEKGDINIELKEEKKMDKKLKILLVEDNKANQMFMEVILQKLNFDYKIANNGQEAVEMVKKEKFDIILMDENMPIKNGIEATKEIREFEKNSSTHTPIIAVTANALDGDKERFLNSGFDEFLPKPVKIDLLKELLYKNYTK